MTRAFLQTCVHGHFGEWLQGRVGATGPVALVTMACPAFHVVAPAQGAAHAKVFSDAQMATFGTALALDVPNWPQVHRTMPLGGGAGASTATLVAQARAAGFTGSDETLAQACLAVEGATDPLMFASPDQLLWASRRAEILQRFAPVPCCDILGGFWGSPQRTVPDDLDFPDISDLIAPWAQAVETGCLEDAAALASTSAQRTCQHRGPQDPMPDLVKDLGALGWVRAHTGSARGLVFACGQVPDQAAEMLTEAGLTGVLTFRTGAA